MHRQRLKFVLLWAACLSYAAQAAVGAGKVLCFSAAATPAESERADHEHDGCAHGEVDATLPVVPPHDEGEHCPCTDVALRSDPGRTDDVNIELPPVEEVDLGVLTPAQADHVASRRAAALRHGLAREPACAFAHPDALHMRSVILLI